MRSKIKLVVEVNQERTGFGIDGGESSVTHTQSEPMSDMELLLRLTAELASFVEAK